MVRVFLILLLFFTLTLPLFAESADTAWVRRYNGTGNDIDKVSAMAVDDSGNVYVTGMSMGSGTNYDYVTIKYYPNGDTGWIRRYNGPPGGYGDWAKDIAVDRSGSVYVTGISDGAETYPDYATIKYNHRGDIAWIRRYNGPQSYYDAAQAIALDDSGNIYVTGQSYDNGLPAFATIKYSPGGDELWVARYPYEPIYSYGTAWDLAVDKSGYIGVTGCLQDHSGTIKYDPNGDTIWVRRTIPSPGSTGYTYSIAIDLSGNIYVTGRYYESGIPYDWVTIKYYPNGDTAWLRRYTGIANTEEGPTKVAVDRLGNVYVTGYGHGIGGTWDSDYVTIKYYPNGDTAWIRRYDGSGQLTDYAYALAIDDSANVYVTGASCSSTTGYDITTIKYNPNGDIVWLKRYTYLSTPWDDEALDMAVDNSGNVYVSGWSIGHFDWWGNPLSDYVTIKYLQFWRGDANGDKKVTVSDVLYLINYLFKGGPAPTLLETGDANCDGNVAVVDVACLINYLFKGGPRPCI